MPEVTPLAPTLHTALPTPKGELPLHYATRLGNIQAMTGLLTPDTDLSRKDLHGLTLWDHAVISKNKETLFTLISHKFGALLSGIQDLFSSVVLNDAQIIGIQSLAYFP